MIGGDLSELGEADTVAAARSLVRERLVAENDGLRLAAHFAQMHSADSLPDGGARHSFRGERAVTLGGAGTPRIAEFAPKTFGLETRMSPGKAQSQFAAVLDLQYRLPRLWREVCAYRVEAWLACMIARRTRKLPLDLVHKVDERIAGRMSGISGDRCCDIVDAETINADPERAARLAEEARRARGVHLGQSNEEGVKTVYSRLSKPDAIWFDAMVQRLADIISTARSPIPGVNARGASTQDEWRAVAQGVLARPLLAGRILLDHEHPDLLSDDATDTADDGEPEPIRQIAERALLTARALRRWLRSVDPRKFLPPVDLYVHVAREAIRSRQLDPVPDGAAARGSEPAVARVEALGPAVLDEVRDWLGSGCQVRVRPVVDLADVWPVDQYEAPPRMREAMQLITPTSMFPYSGNRSRRKEADHAVAYRRRSSTDPPGFPQTGLHSLGPLSEGEHRYRTFAPVQLRQPVPGVRVWRTRFGTVLVENDSGTHDLGNSPFARAVWEAATAMNPALTWYRSVMIMNGERSAAEECVKRAIVPLGT